MSRNARNWCFTSYNDDEFYVDIEEDRRIRYCVYQYELCPRTQRKHIQGYLELTTPLSMAAVKTLIHDNTAHVEKRRGSRSEARAYCMKEETRHPNFDGPIEIGEWHGEEGERQRTDLAEAKRIIQSKPSWQAVLNCDELANIVARHSNWARQVYEARVYDVPTIDIVLRNWQNEVIGMLDEPVQKRRIIWIWSAESGTGKTTFFDYCSAKYNVLPGTDYVNTLYAYDGQGVIWFDLSRHQTHDHIPYHALEKLSNQTIHLSTKYVTTRKYVSSHIVVTANIAPDEQKIPNRCVTIYASLL